MSHENYIQFVNKHRKEKDEGFKTSHHSPITHEEQHHFSGLNYFPPDPKYLFTVQIDEYKEKKKKILTTNTGQAKDYNVFGKIEFKIDGETFQLQVYVTEEDPDYYSILFMDQTSGKETYGAGRYTELIPDQNNKNTYALDFNLAYSPFCAYNDNYSCPIPPKENRLNVSILAGEKNYREY